MIETDFKSKQNVERMTMRLRWKLRAVKPWNYIPLPICRLVDALSFWSVKLYRPWRRCVTIFMVERSPTTFPMYNFHRKPQKFMTLYISLNSTSVRYLQANMLLNIFIPSAWHAFVAGQKLDFDKKLDPLWKSFSSSLILFFICFLLRILLFQWSLLSPRFSILT